MITDHLQYLIICHDCVVLPGIGAFLARYESARLTPDGLTILPPHRVTGFNADLTHDDGLLAGSIARSTGCGYEAASAEVSREAEAILRRLDAGQTVILNRIGSLSRSESGAIAFQPVADDESVANAIYASLPHVAVPADAVGVGCVPRVLDVDLTPRRAPFIVRAMRYAAAAAVVIGVAITASTPVMVNRDTNFASISAPAITVEKPRYVPASDFGRELFVVRPDSASSMAVVAPKVQTATDEPGYYLIVASFVTEREANRYIAEHSDARLRVVKGDRRSRVYAASGSSFVEASALSADRDFSERYPDAWVYKKK